MNSLQAEIAENLKQVYNQNDVPLVFSEDRSHKAFQWMLMLFRTEVVWDREFGFADKDWGMAFNLWVDLKENKN